MAKSSGNMHDEVRRSVEEQLISQRRPHIIYETSDAIGKMTAYISSMAQGLVEFRNVRLIRIKSRKHTLLIMEDFAPVIGEVQGEVVVVSGEEEHRFEVKRGFYMHTRNRFSLIITHEGTLEGSQEGNASTDKEEDGE